VIQDGEFFNLFPANADFHINQSVLINMSPLLFFHLTQSNRVTAIY